ncbi:MAG: type VI secretion system tube protein TssD [Candidatus Zixiibacteriota bacterium]
MARRPTLEIDGVKYDNVYQVSYELYTAKDETGRPTDRAHAGLVKIKRESDEKVDIARWAMKTDKTNWKAGSIKFYSMEDAEMKTVKWEDGFITHYEEHVPHIKDNPNDQIWEYFEISCQKLWVSDAEIDNRWKE